MSTEVPCRICGRLTKGKRGICWSTTRCCKENERLKTIENANAIPAPDSAGLHLIKEELDGDCPPSPSKCSRDGCESDASRTWQDIPLCGECFTAVINRALGRTAETVDKARVSSNAGHFPGWTYIIQLPNKNIKIGYTGDVDIVAGRGLNARFYRLSKSHNGPVTVLAVIPGGFTKECELHVKFAGLRVSDVLGEQFLPDVELIKFALSAGVHPSAQSSADYWSGREPKSESSTNHQAAA